MWETALLVALIFLVLGAGLRIILQKTMRKRHDAIAPGKFDFDTFKSREMTRRGVHDTTRLGKKR